MNDDNDQQTAADLAASIDHAERDEHADLRQQIAGQWQRIVELERRIEGYASTTIASSCGLYGISTHETDGHHVIVQGGVARIVAGPFEVERVRQSEQRCADLEREVAALRASPIDEQLRADLARVSDRWAESNTEINRLNREEVPHAQSWRRIDRALAGVPVELPDEEITGDPCVDRVLSLKRRLGDALAARVEADERYGRERAGLLAVIAAKLGTPQGQVLMRLDELMQTKKSVERLRANLAESDRIDTERSQSLAAVTYERDAARRELQAFREATMLDPEGDDWSKVTPGHLRQHIQDLGDLVDGYRHKLERVSEISRDLSRIESKG